MDYAERTYVLYTASSTFMYPDIGTSDLVDGLNIAKAIHNEYERDEVIDWRVIA